MEGARIDGADSGVRLHLLDQLIDRIDLILQIRIRGCCAARRGKDGAVEAAAKKCCKYATSRDNP
jgi:hypothetical protein